MRVALAGVIAAVLATASVAFAGNIVRLGPAANGSAVSLQSGDSLVLQLPGNKAKGYTWAVRSVDGDVLKLVSRAYFAPNADHPGIFVLRFQAAAPLSTTLRLVYSRPSAKPAKTFSLRIAVK